MPGRSVGRRVAGMPRPRALRRAGRAAGAGRATRTNPDAAGFSRSNACGDASSMPGDTDRARFVIEHRFRWRRVFTELLRDDYTPPT